MDMFDMMLAQAFAAPATGNGPDDEFDYGSSIDTTGARYTGAYPWTILNQRTGTVSVSGGQLSMTCAALTSPDTMDPILAVETIDAGNGVWKTYGFMTGASLNFQGVGLVLRESGTGKMTCFGYATDSGSLGAQVRRLTSSYKGWVANYNGGLPPGASDTVSYLRIIREGTMLSYQTSEDDSSWREEARVPVTADFTTAPDQVGLWVNAIVGATRTGTWEFFRKVSFSLPYTALLPNPGAENGTTGWNNVTGTIGTRSGVGIPHAGSFAFKINGNPGAFEVYTEWALPAELNTLIDTGTKTVTAGLWGNPWTGATTTYRMRFDARDSGGSILATGNTTFWTPSAYSQKTVSFTVPANTRKFRVTVEGTTAAADDGWWDDLTIDLT